MVDPTGAVKAAFAVIQKVYSRIQDSNKNNEVCARIVQNLKMLQKIATNLEELQQEELPESCRKVIDNFNSSLDVCKRTCTNLNRVGSCKKILFVEQYESELSTLDSELKKACDNLQIVLSQVSILETRRVHSTVVENTQFLNAAVINPKQGVYLPNRRASRQRPCKIERPQVYLEADDNAEDLMVVKWTDDKHKERAIERYEVRYDDENEQVIHATVEECMTCDIPNEFQIKFGSPKIKPGNLYTIQVCGVNGAGPGEWSDAVLFRFKTGPPNKPKKPSVLILSPTEVSVTVKRLAEDDENGSHVAYCKVEYTDGYDHDWKHLEARLTDQDVKIAIHNLTPNTAYKFRTRMINNSRESVPSDSITIVTTQLIPGPPQNLRISTKRTDTSIKLRWEKPDKNPQAVSQYRVQKHPSNQVQWEDYETVDKLSCKITGLKTDTKYTLRVKSVNNKGQSGNWSDEISTETRYGVFGRTVCTIGAFVGGTLGGPGVGAVGGGLIASTAAEKVPYSDTAKSLARISAGAGGAVMGAIFGIIGAPIIGGASAAMANVKLSGETGDVSPQSSDDESEDPGLMTKMFVNSNRVAKDLLREDQ